jgi:hypothetical protein
MALVKWIFLAALVWSLSCTKREKSVEAPPAESFMEESPPPIAGRNTVIPDPSELRPMNGIDPKVATKYWERWHFVTTRYRKDNDQMRIVFANDLAWEAMVKRSKSYPEGAMFAKAIFHGGNDPVFPASVIPGTYFELELMKKDSKAYRKTGGWGFALWIYPHDTHSRAKEEMKSCFSCHSLVAKRDHVFALPAFLQWQNKDSSISESHFEKAFDLVNTSELKGYEKRLLENYAKRPFDKFKHFQLESFNTGQRNSIASVAQFTVKSGVPHLVTGKNASGFLLITPMTKEEKKEFEKTDEFKQKSDEDGECVNYAMTAYRAPNTVDSGHVCGMRIFWERRNKIFAEETRTP